MGRGVLKPYKDVLAAHERLAVLGFTPQHLKSRFEHDRRVLRRSNKLRLDDPVDSSQLMLTTELLECAVAMPDYHEHVNQLSVFVEHPHSNGPVLDAAARLLVDRYYARTGLPSGVEYDASLMQRLSLLCGMSSTSVQALRLVAGVPGMADDVSASPHMTVDLVPVLIESGERDVDNAYAAMGDTDTLDMRRFMKLGLVPVLMYRHLAGHGFVSEDQAAQLVKLALNTLDSLDLGDQSRREIITAMIDPAGPYSRHVDPAVLSAFMIECVTQ